MSGFVIACLLALSPTNLSPFLVNATTDGVVLTPSAFAIIVGLGFALGRVIKTDDTIRAINQKICKQLYQQNTNKYINCSTKDINENIKLIKDITND